MIDPDGFRANVGIILANSSGQLLWARRIGQDSWQFPQGGMDPGETPEEAMYRELYEEVGLKPEHVKVLGVTDGWLRYHLPRRYIRQHQRPLCVGQKQKWFLLELITDDSQINLHAVAPHEFDDFAWVSYWFPLTQVIDFKRSVYLSAMLELLPLLPLDEPNFKGYVRATAQKPLNTEESS